MAIPSSGGASAFTFGLRKGTGQRGAAQETLLRYAAGAGTGAGTHDAGPRTVRQGGLHPVLRGCGGGQLQQQRGVPKPWQPPGAAPSGG